MNDVFDTFIRILEKSTEKHKPETPLTLGHILNIAKMARNIHDTEEANRETELQAAYDRIMEDHLRYGKN